MLKILAVGSVDQSPRQATIQFLLENNDREQIAEKIRSISGKDKKELLPYVIFAVLKFELIDAWKSFLSPDSSGSKKQDITLKDSCFEACFKQKSDQVKDPFLVLLVVLCAKIPEKYAGEILNLIPEDNVKIEFMNKLDANSLSQLTAQPIFIPWLKQALTQPAQTQTLGEVIGLLNDSVRERLLSEHIMPGLSKETTLNLFKGLPMRVLVSMTDHPHFIPWAKQVLLEEVGKTQSWQTQKLANTIEKSRNAKELMGKVLEGLEGPTQVFFFNKCSAELLVTVTGHSAFETWVRDALHGTGQDFDQKIQKIKLSKVLEQSQDPALRVRISNLI